LDKNRWHSKGFYTMAQTVLRLKEVRRRLGISNTTLYEDWINGGRLRVVRLGPRAVGVIEADLDQAIADLPRREISAG
jgi:predicted DNA-binding transcriptional regulator AlpA